MHPPIVRFLEQETRFLCPLNIFLSKKGILLKRELTKRGLSEQEVEIKLDEWNKINEAKLAEALKKKEQASSAKAKKSEKVEESAKEVKGAASGDAEIEEKPAAE